MYVAFVLGAFTALIAADVVVFAAGQPFAPIGAVVSLVQVPNELLLLSMQQCSPHEHRL